MIKNYKFKIVQIKDIKRNTVDINKMIIFQLIEVQNMIKLFFRAIKITVYKNLTHHHYHIINLLKMSDNYLKKRLHMK